jgi:hypothetical protein
LLLLAAFAESAKIENCLEEDNKIQSLLLWFKVEDEITRTEGG